MGEAVLNIPPHTISSHRISPNQPVYIIAEVGISHLGSLNTAKRLIEAARFAGAQAVKFQAFRAEELATQSSPKPSYQEEALGEESQYNLLRRTELSPDSLRILSDYCKTMHITFLCSVFDRASAQAYAILDHPAFKIGSGELTNFPLLEYIASYGKPMILSTGMATLEEVGEALDVLGVGPDTVEVALLHCVSNYPANSADCNL